MSMQKPQGPVLIEIKDEAPAIPAEAPPVPDGPAPTGQAMQTVAALVARPPSRIGRWFWSSLLALVSFIASVAAWNFVMGLIAANPILGWIATALIALFIGVLLVIAVREFAAFARLGRIDRLRAEADAAIADNNLGAARHVVFGLARLYASRDDTKWGRDRLADRQSDAFDADALLGLAEAEVLAPLDAAALREVEVAARQVATVTALVPLALADVVAALTSNLRMIRRIAEVYGGRSGTFGSWRLARAVLSHLVATGAVAVGDDLIGSFAGGSVLSKISRRFGEGLINGALTARVGVAAIEVCRPLPFRATPRPSVTKVVRRALTGLFESKS